jgi:CBS domain-containing protein
VAESEYVKEELERLSSAPKELPTLSSDSFRKPLQQLMSKDAITVEEDQTVGEAMAKMQQSEYGAVLVTHDGKLTGMLTERDLICHVIGVVDDYEQARVGDVMQRDPIRLQKSDPIVYALHDMQVEGYRHVPIVDAEDRPVSVVSIKDVVRYILSHFPKDVYNVTPEPYRGPKKREGA